VFYQLVLQNRIKNKIVRLFFEQTNKTLTPSLCLKLKKRKAILFSFELNEEKLVLFSVPHVVQATKQAIKMEYFRYFERMLWPLVLCWPLSKLA